MESEEDGVADLIGLTHPQAIMQAPHRRRLADIDVVVLRRSYHDGIAAVLHQCRKRHRLIAIFLVEAEKMGRGCEHFVDRGLNIRPHMAGKLPRRDHQPIACNSGEMPIERDMGVAELLRLQSLRGVENSKHATGAQARRLARERHLPHSHRAPAQIARPVGFHVFARDRQTMAGGMDTTLRRLKQGLGDRKRIRAARGLAAVIDQRTEGYRLPLPQAEHTTQELSDELDGRVIIVVKDKLNRLGENVVHERPPAQPQLERTKTEHHEARRASRGKA